MTNDDEQTIERNKTIKNILILSASPRKGGNSDLLCDQFAKGSVKNLPVYQDAYEAGKTA